MRASHVTLAVAWAAACNLAIAGCGRAWPAVRPVCDPSFSSGATVVQRIDVLPIDVDIGAHTRLDPEEVAARFDAGAVQAIAQALYRRGYAVGGFIDWSGRYSAPGGAAGVAMSEPALMATVNAMAALSQVQAEMPGQLLAATLPVPLGEATASDATLYVTGEAYAAPEHHGPGAGDVAKWIFIGAVIVVVVIVIAVAARRSGGGGGGGGAGRVAGHAAGAVGRGATAAGRGIARFGGAMRPAVRAVGRGTLRTVDALGHAHVDLEVAPLPEDPPATPRARGGRSHMYLEMTLVDNRTGQTLWHAHQDFAATPASDQDVAEAFLRMLLTLPGTGSGVASR